MNKIHTFFERYGLFLSILLACIGSFLYSALSLLHHVHFQSGAFDLGIFDQSLWQYAHFLYPYNTIKEKFILGDHLNLTMPLLVPLYWVWDDVRSILIFQAVWVSFSSVGIYLYSKKRTLTSLQSLLLSFSYLFFYGIQFGLFFDFHPILLAVGLMAWILYFWEEASWKLFWISIVLFLLTQENTGIALLGLCCIWFFQRKRLRLVILLGVIGFVATAISFYAIHLLSQGHLQYVPQFPKTIPGIISAFYDAPDKKEVWLYTYISYAFLPLLSIGSVLAVVGDLSQYFITGAGFNHMWSPFLHHRAILAIFLIAGLSDVLLFIKNRKSKLTTPLVLGICIWSIFITYHYHFAVTKLVHKDFWQSESWMTDNYAVMKQIPPSASLAAQQSLVPHVSHRREIYLIYPRLRKFGANSPCGRKECWWLDFAGKPEYLFVDTHPNEWLTMTLENIDNFTEAVHNMEKTGAIQLSASQNDAELFKINSAKVQQNKIGFGLGR